METENNNGKKKKIQLNYEADNMFITSIKNGQMKVIDHRFNKMLVDGKLFADMDSYKKVLLCMYEYLEIKEDVIWDDYQNFKPYDWDEYDEEFEIEDDDF